MNCVLVLKIFVKKSALHVIDFSSQEGHLPYHIQQRLDQFNIGCTPLVQISRRCSFCTSIVFAKNKIQIENFALTGRAPVM